MVTWQESGGTITFFGLSADTKPTEVERVKGIQHDVPNGSAFIEMDTGDIYFFDKENISWRKQ